MSVSRRLVLGGVGAAVASGAWGQQGRAFRLGHQFALDHPIAIGAAKSAEALGQLSGGRLRIDVFPAGQLGTGKEIDQQVSDDSLDFCIDGPGILGTWWRPVSIYEAPFVARDWDQLVRMMEGPWGQAQFDQLAAKGNLRKVGTPWYYGARHLTTRDRAVHTVADCKGLKIRVPEVPVYIDMIRAIGATPTPMALAEVYLSLQTGVVDGQENPIPTIYSLKFFEVQKYLNLTSHIITPQVALMSEKRWAVLPAADRALITQAFDAGRIASDAVLREQERTLAGKMQAAGMTVIEPDREAFRIAMAPVFDKNEQYWGKGALAQLQAMP